MALDWNQFKTARENIFIIKNVAAIKNKALLKKIVAASKGASKTADLRSMQGAAGTAANIVVQPTLLTAGASLLTVNALGATVGVSLYTALSLSYLTGEAATGILSTVKSTGKALWNTDVSLRKTLLNQDAISLQDAISSSEEVTGKAKTEITKYLSLNLDPSNNWQENQKRLGEIAMSIKRNKSVFENEDYDLIKEEIETKRLNFKLIEMANYTPTKKDLLELMALIGYEKDGSGTLNIKKFTSLLKNNKELAEKVSKNIEDSGLLSQMADDAQNKNLRAIFDKSEQEKTNGSALEKTDISNKLVNLDTVDLDKATNLPLINAMADSMAIGTQPEEILEKIKTKFTYLNSTTVEKNITEGSNLTKYIKEVVNAQIILCGKGDEAILKMLGDRFANLTGIAVEEVIKELSEFKLGETEENIPEKKDAISLLLKAARNRVSQIGVDLELDYVLKASRDASAMEEFDLTSRIKDIEDKLGEQKDEESDSTKFKVTTLYEKLRKAETELTKLTNTNPSEAEQKELEKRVEQEFKNITEEELVEVNKERHEKTTNHQIVVSVKKSRLKSIQFEIANQEQLLKKARGDTERKEGDVDEDAAKEAAKEAVEAKIKAAHSTLLSDLEKAKESEVKASAQNEEAKAALAAAQTAQSTAKFNNLNKDKKAEELKKEAETKLEKEKIKLNTARDNLKQTIPAEKDNDTKTLNEALKDVKLAEANLAIKTEELKKAEKEDLTRQQKATEELGKFEASLALANEASTQAQANLEEATNAKETAQKAVEDYNKETDQTAEITTAQTTAEEEISEADDNTKKQNLAKQKQEIALKAFKDFAARNKENRDSVKKQVVNFFDKDFAFLLGALLENYDSEKSKENPVTWEISLLFDLLDEKLERENLTIIDKKAKKAAIIQKALTAVSYEKKYAIAEQQNVLFGDRGNSKLIRFLALESRNSSGILKNGEEVNLGTLPFEFFSKDDGYYGQEVLVSMPETGKPVTLIKTIHQEKGRNEVSVIHCAPGKKTVEGAHSVRTVKGFGEVKLNGFAVREEKLPNGKKDITFAFAHEKDKPDVAYQTVVLNGETFLLKAEVRGEDGFGIGLSRHHVGDLTLTLLRPSKTLNSSNLPESYEEVASLDSSKQKAKWNIKAGKSFETELNELQGHNIRIIAEEFKHADSLTTQSVEALPKTRRELRIENGLTHNIDERKGEKRPPISEQYAAFFGSNRQPSVRFYHGVDSTTKLTDNEFFCAQIASFFENEQLIRFPNNTIKKVLTIRLPEDITPEAIKILNEYIANNVGDKFSVVVDLKGCDIGKQGTTSLVASCPEITFKNDAWVKDKSSIAKAGDRISSYFEAPSESTKQPTKSWLGFSNGARGIIFETNTLQQKGLQERVQNLESLNDKALKDELKALLLGLDKDKEKGLLSKSNLIELFKATQKNGEDKDLTRKRGGTFSTVDAVAILLSVHARGEQDFINGDLKDSKFAQALAFYDPIQFASLEGSPALKILEEFRKDVKGAKGDLKAARDKLIGNMAPLLGIERELGIDKQNKAWKGLAPEKQVALDRPHTSLKPSGDSSRLSEKGPTRVMI